MTRTYEYKFSVLKQKVGTDGHNQEDWYREEVTLRKKVTDRMEEREVHKAGYAAGYFNTILRSKYGYNKSVVTAARVTEVTA